MIQRRKLSDIVARNVALKVANDRLELRRNGKLVATVNLDDLFDKDGNRFEDDVQA